MLIRSLEMFTAVVETGSFSAAAERLHTVQSNVTAHIKKLEAELEVSLLSRRTPVAPTPAGHQLLDYARRIGALHAQARACFRADGEPAGELRLGSMETTAAVHLPRLLTTFARRWPSIAVHLRTGTSAELIEALRAGQLDAAFLAVEGEEGDDLLMKPVFEERLVLVSGRPLQGGLPDRQTLSRTPFLAFRQGCGYRQTVEMLLAGQRAPAPRIHEFGSLDAIVGCVAAGMGVAVLPESAVGQYRQRFQLHIAELPDDLARVTTVIASTPKGTWSRALAVFMEGEWMPEARSVA
ncbi:LysR family transcriptional regulator [Alloalcanivorax mobilis]|uniref:LysR family transcriptional regulator n=1 Tax=Alloalcanivorax mobilis TaxID=2019569 RepID=UPI000B5B4962|nr:LysR family transcriptional regulator [Alloalcanivorax mobilis]ASK35553.1 LysR family transcriptional regulator [Alcanivorax sp. N3-2A]|tara:strand:- start:5577 stop:6461 length:885 start_codon:yes stop_codon:yes gene_type:complete